MADNQPGTGRRGEGAWTVRLCTVSGIPIRLHFTFLVLLLWLGLSASKVSGGSWQGFAFIASVFGCVILHELGHSLVAQRFGIGVAEIVLYPMGGVARLERLPKPPQEFWIALAGPAVNVVIAGILWPIIAARGGMSPWEQLSPVGGNWLQQLMGANLVLAAFNMLPAFPMDGGRVLRSLLAFRMGEVKATELAASIGQLAAFGLGLAGLVYSSIILLFIAFFVYIGAGQEAAMYRGRALVGGVPTKEAMITEFKCLPADATIGQAADLLLETSQQDFPVVHGSEILGVLSRQALLRGLAVEGPSGYVVGAMTRDYPRAEPDDDLEETVARLQASGQSCMLVMEDETIKGLLTMENLAEFLVVRQITASRRRT